MDNQEIIKAYTSALRAVEYFESEAGKALAKERNDVYQKALDTVMSLRESYYNALLESDPAITPLINETNEALRIVKFLPDSEHDAVKELNELIEKNSKAVQNQLTFNPETFYDKYFYTIASSLQDKSAELKGDVRFNEWFGNSKVVDGQGNPLIVYHGTGGDVNEFTRFKFSPFPGNYFAENKSYSEFFAKYRGGSSYMYRVYLRVTNPLDLTEFGTEKVTYDDFVNYISIKYGYDMPFNKMLKAMSDKSNGMWAWRYLRFGPDWIKFIEKTKEFDGFHYYENNPDDMQNGKENVTKAWMVLRPTQIKIADGRNDTWSLFSEDALMKKGGVVC